MPTLDFLFDHVTGRLHGIPLTNTNYCYCY